MSVKRIDNSRRRSRPAKKKNPFEKKEMKIGVLLIVIFAMIASVAIYINMNAEEKENPIAVIDTSMGTIKVELYKDKVPNTCDNFIRLADDGFYSGLVFHRVIEDFMIQSGDPKGDGTGGHAAEYHEGYGDPNDPDTWTIPDEFDKDLSNVRGTISMANKGADTNTGSSQFFINVKDNTYLDFNNDERYKHAVFGKVIDGMDVVDAISKVNTDSNDKPTTDVVINSVTIVNE